MKNRHPHPGKKLLKMISDSGLTQRELASKIGITHSVINSIIKGTRNINVATALALESAKLGEASEWMGLQAMYSIDHAKADSKISRKNELIKIWNEVDGDYVPLSFFKKHCSEIKTPEDLPKLYQIYGVENFGELTHRIDEFPLKLFRKSSKFQERKVNVVAWSVLAEHKARQLKVNKFDLSKEKELLNELQICLYKNKDVLNKVGKVLSNYGIKFFTLDRPSKTPVEGVSFMSEGSPTIVMTLKYKRLDNFAFGLFHELGHVFKHLTYKRYKDYNFYTNNSKENELEREADLYASNNLIDKNVWHDFIVENEIFSDSLITRFAKKHKIHPCIVRGRVCFTYQEYYRKRSIFNSKNFLGE